mgnify:CR=1 FL=1
MVWTGYSWVRRIDHQNKTEDRWMPARRKRRHGYSRRRRRRRQQQKQQKQQQDWTCAHHVPLALLAQLGAPSSPPTTWRRPSWQMTAARHREKAQAVSQCPQPLLQAHRKGTAGRIAYRRATYRCSRSSPVQRVVPGGVHWFGHARWLHFVHAACTACVKSHERPSPQSAGGGDSHGPLGWKRQSFHST